jgi:hypothetical protein
MNIEKKKYKSIFKYIQTEKKAHQQIYTYIIDINTLEA